jgi:LytS/YehU family sensor histidine kinase
VLQLYNNILSAANWPYWLFFLLSVLIICILFYLRERRIKAATAKEMTMHHMLVNLELHAFQAQMDPHFIFNSLNAIHHYILTTSTDMASLYLTRFSKLMRLMIGNFNKEWVNLQDDLEALELYMQLEQLRFDQQFAYHVRLMPEIMHQFTLIPPLIIQPFVQYAIWHRILQRPQKNGGRLYIIIGKEDDRLYIQIEDNGVDAVAAEESAEQTQTAGVDIAAERLYMMSEKYHMDASIDTQLMFDDQQQCCGNRITISMQHFATRQSLAV